MSTLLTYSVWLARPLAFGDKAEVTEIDQANCENEAALRRGIELLYFGYSHMTRNADARLVDHGLGRAHHRTLYFVARQPGLMIGDLLKLLNVTKQSLARVLNDLAKREMVESRAGEQDRRQRHLRLTEAGARLEQQLFSDLCSALAPAYDTTGERSVAQFWAVLEQIIPEPDRTRVLSLQAKQ